MIEPGIYQINYRRVPLGDLWHHAGGMRRPLVSFLVLMTWKIRGRIRPAMHLPLRFADRMIPRDRLPAEILADLDALRAHLPQDLADIAWTVSSRIKNPNLTSVDGAFHLHDRAATIIHLTYVSVTHNRRTSINKASIATTAVTETTDHRDIITTNARVRQFRPATGTAIERRIDDTPAAILARHHERLLGRTDLIAIRSTDHAITLIDQRDERRFADLISRGCYERQS
jgi:hypothetical protein